MFSLHSTTGILVVLLISGMMMGRSNGGIGLKPIDFFRFSDEDLGKVIQVSFQPDEGLRLREKFEKKFGAKGENLIKSLGDGQILIANTVNTDS